MDCVRQHSVVAVEEDDDDNGENQGTAKLRERANLQNRSVSVLGISHFLQRVGWAITICWSDVQSDIQSVSSSYSCRLRTPFGRLQLFG